MRKITLKNIAFKHKNMENFLFKNLDVTFTTEKPNILIGYNGAGKTTLFDLLTGLDNLKLQSGEIQDIPDKRQIIYQTQSANLFGVLTGRDVETFIFGTSTGYQAIDFTQLSLHHRELYESLQDKKVGVMSLGERRWLLIFLLSHLDKELFLLDEPTSGVDPISRQQIMQDLNKLVKMEDRKKTVIISTHILEDIQNWDCMIHLLNKGKILSFDNYTDFLSGAETTNPNIAFEYYIQNYFV